jgi:hypothetical protein
VRRVAERASLPPHDTHLDLQQPYLHVALGVLGVNASPILQGRQLHPLILRTVHRVDGQVVVEVQLRDALKGGNEGGDRRPSNIKQRTAQKRVPTNTKPTSKHFLRWG